MYIIRVHLKGCDIRMVNMESFFRANICYLRRRDGLSQKEMAQILGISIGTYRKIEQNEPSVRLYDKMIVRVARHFHYTADELVLLDLEITDSG